MALTLRPNVLLSIPFFARRNDSVGQVGRGTLWVRRIVNPPAGSEHNAGESPEKFAACRFVGQVGNLRRIVNPPAGSGHNAGESPEKFAPSRFVGQPILAAAGFRPVLAAPQEKLSKRSSPANMNQIQIAPQIREIHRSRPWQ